MKEKFCKGCKQILPIENFTKSTNVKDGYENKCKKCRKEARLKYIKNCEVCGNEFRTARKQSRFCSIDCQGIARRKRIKKRCSFCKKIIEVKKSISNKHEHYYCNQNCRTEHLKEIMSGENNPNYNRVDYKCDGCGENIKVVPSKLAEQKYVFCSNECYRRHIGKFFLGKNNPNFVENILLNCDGCGEMISRKPGDINFKGKNYCSRECHIKHQFIPTGITYYKHECLECNIVFKTQVKDSKFCSKKCKNLYQSKHFRGENHPLYNPNLSNEERQIKRKYTEYYEWRKSVYKRDNYTCQYCGDNKGGNLVAHHIYNYSEHEDLRTNIDNGVTLCETCHKNFHDKYGYSNNNREQLNEFINNFQKAPIPL